MIDHSKPFGRAWQDYASWDICKVVFELCCRIGWKKYFEEQHPKTCSGTEFYAKVT